MRGAWSAFFCVLLGLLPASAAYAQEQSDADPYISMVCAPYDAEWEGLETSTVRYDVEVFRDRIPHGCTQVLEAANRRLEELPPGPPIQYAPGGHPALAEAWPFFAALRAVSVEQRRLDYFCGGALIDTEWVVTAAHCINGWRAEDGRWVHDSGAVLEVVVGAVDVSLVRRQQIHQVAGVYVHPDFDAGDRSYHNDIALIRLASPSNAYLVDLDRPQDASFEAAGFGLLQEGGALVERAVNSEYRVRVGSERLMQVELQAMGCPGVYSNVLEGRQLCFGRPFGGIDTCRGDSGGPLVARRPGGMADLVAIVSFGRGCARRAVPGVYTAVAPYLPWMRELIVANGGRDILAREPIVFDPASVPGEIRFVGGGLPGILIRSEPGHWRGIAGAPLHEGEWREVGAASRPERLRLASDGDIMEVDVSAGGIFLLRERSGDIPLRFFDITATAPAGSAEDALSLLGESAQRQYCENENWAALEALARSACGRLIEAGRETAQSLGARFREHGAAAFAAGDHGRAFQAYTQAFDLDGRDLEAARGIARVLEAYAAREFNIYARAASYARVAEAYTAVLGLAPTDVDARKQRANAYLIAGEAQTALGDIDAVLSVDPNDAEAYVMRAVALSASGRDADAIESVTRSIEIDPSNDDARLFRTRLLNDAGRHQEALDDYDILLADEPRAQSLLNGRCWTLALWGQRLEEALRNCNAALELASDGATLNSRALVYFKRGDFARAEADYDAAVRAAEAANTTDFGSLYGRGVSRLRLGQTEAGLADVERARSTFTGGRLDGRVTEVYANYGVTTQPADERALEHVVDERGRRWTRFSAIVPEIIGPRPNARFPAGSTVRLAWRPIDGAESYIVEIEDGVIGEDEEFDSDYHFDLTSAELSFVLTTPSARWRVWAKDRDNTETQRTEWRTVRARN